MWEQAGASPQPFPGTLDKHHTRKTKETVKEQQYKKCVPHMFVFDLILQWRSLNIIFILELEIILLQLLLFSLYGVITKLLHVLLSESNVEDIMEMEDIMEVNIQPKNSNCCL